MKDHISIQASDTALQYVKAALKKGHEISGVFFYNDGVNNATRLATPPQDDRNITKEWLLSKRSA